MSVVQFDKLLTFWTKEYFYQCASHILNLKTYKFDFKGCPNKSDGFNFGIKVNIYLKVCVIYILIDIAIKYGNLLEIARLYLTYKHIMFG